MKAISSNKCISAALVSLALLASSDAWAETFFMKLTGKLQGDIEGDVVQRGKEGSIQVLTMTHEIVSLRDAASGLPTGKRQHKPIVVRIPVDKSFPKLYQALVTNESLSSVEIKSFDAPSGRSGAAAQKHAWTLTLTNASIAGISSLTQAGAKPNDKDQLLEVSFTYQKIEWTWVNGGITATDDWEAVAN